MERLKIIAVTHKRVNLDIVGKLVIADDELGDRLTAAKNEAKVDELMFLSTCNRAEFVVVTDREIDNDWLGEFYTVLHPGWSEDTVEDIVIYSEVYEAANAVQHLLNVASSLDSLVIGEREIITQVRRSFETCSNLGLTGDIIRLLIRKTIETAKQVYTETAIATRPVSVVSLAYRQLTGLNLPTDSRIVVVGTGQTNTTMLRLLKKRGYKNLSIYNRTLAAAERLANEVGGTPYGISELPKHQGGFDLLIVCTAAPEPTVDREIYTKLLAGESGLKIVIDLGVPNDLASDVVDAFPMDYISINALKQVAEENLKLREREVQLCRAIIGENLKAFHKVFQAREIELAMRQVPIQVKEIHENAINNVFADELDSMDEETREVVKKMMEYLQKKYISVPMKMAREILLDKTTKK